MKPRDIDGVGLYVHVPFCRQLCPYCDFAVAVRKDPPHDAYCDALLDELASRSEDFGDAPATVYFGGGTPAMWTTDALARLLTHVELGAAAEVTIEANPLDITPGRLDEWAALGIDRVSLGVQSFDDDALAGLGRDHDGAQARKAAEQVIAHDAFRTSVDLIYGGPNYDATVLDADLEVVARLQPDHVSAYELTVETNTVFGRRQRAGTLRLPAHDDVVDAGFDLIRGLRELGFERYEVSSFGRGGDRGLHNSGYWLGREYVGLGVGAHSLERASAEATRRANVRRLRAYLADPTSPAAVEQLDSVDHLGERLLLGSRTTIGVGWADLRRQFDTVDEAVWRRVDATAREMIERELLHPGGALRATPRGLNVADAIAERFWAATRIGEQPG